MLPWVMFLLLIASVVLLLIILHRLLRSDNLNEFRDELRVGREEARQAARESRDEISTNLRNANETVSSTLTGMAAIQRAQLDGVAEQIRRLVELNRESFTRFGESNQASLDRISSAIDSELSELHQSNEAKFGEIRRTLENKLTQNVDAISQGLTQANQQFSMNVKDSSEVQRIQLDSMAKELKALGQSNEVSLERVRVTLDSRVKELQDSNERKLDDMRRTVDEKLHETLGKRLDGSFSVVSERLEAVQRGLGEMQNLATGVGDLQRVLTNVKVRGTWAEVQLGNLLDQILAPGQYERNVRVKPESNESVEYAVRLPGRKQGVDDCLWLPIDSKFPQEDYKRLQDAADCGDPEATRKATEELCRTIRTAAQQVHAKYINPPRTTDFAIMFLATEGLYGEALRHPSLIEDLQRRYRIVVAGPTTLIAILNSLRVGFQTLAIEQRASEIATVLGGVKTEFGKFGEVLDKVKRQLHATTRTIENTGVRSRAIERKLKSVEQLPDAQAAAVLQLPDNEVMALDEFDQLLG